MARQPARTTVLLLGDVMVHRLSRGALTGALVLVLALSVLPLTGAAASRGASAVAEVSLAAASPDFRPTEAVFLHGVVTAADGVAGLEVEVQGKAPQGRWTPVATTTTDRRGRFTVEDRPGSRRRYRAVLRSSGSTSAVVGVSRTTRPRGLPRRRADLSPLIGKETSPVRTARRYGKRVRHQRLKRALLVKVGRSTSVVRRPMLRHYRNTGGLAGRLGAPLEDRTCRLMEGACIQRFQGGSIYLNQRARRPVSIGYARNRSSMILAAALSQQGYREPHYRGSKYGAWQGSDQAWCGIFLAWASHASGRGNAIPRADAFPTMVSRLRARGRTSRRPQIGAVAIYGRSRPWHAGLVVAVRGNRILTIEGNIDRHGGSGHPRGVHRSSRPISSVKFFAMPRGG